MYLLHRTSYPIKKIGTSIAINMISISTSTFITFLQSLSITGMNICMTICSYLCTTFEPYMIFVSKNATKLRPNLIKNEINQTQQTENAFVYKKITSSSSSFRFRCCCYYLIAVRPEYASFRYKMRIYGSATILVCEKKKIIFDTKIII